MKIDGRAGPRHDDVQHEGRSQHALSAAPGRERCIGVAAGKR